MTADVDANLSDEWGGGEARSSYPGPDEIDLSRNPDNLWIGVRDFRGGESWYEISASDELLAAAYRVSVERVSAAKWLPRRSETWFQAHGITVTRVGGWIDSD